MLVTVYITAGDLNVTLFSLFLNFLTYFFKSYLCFCKLNPLETVMNVKGPQRPTDPLA